MSSRSAEIESGLAGLDGFESFCSELTLEDGAPFVLEDFQREMLSDYFSGTRETLVLIPKKNGKSTLVSALALHHLLVTENAECVVAAASRDQATILYDQAAGFVRRSETLTELLHVKRGYREIRCADRPGRRASGRNRSMTPRWPVACGRLPMCWWGRSAWYGIWAAPWASRSAWK